MKPNQKSDEEIIICPKTENVSFDEIYHIIHTAHQENRNKGIIVNSSVNNGEDLRKHIRGENAVWYIAKDGSKVIGTVSLCKIKENRWFCREKEIAYLQHLAVLPEYRGKKIAYRFCREAEEYAKANNLPAIELVVVEENPAINLYLKLNYECVDYIYKKDLKQFSVRMIKWIGKQPYSSVMRKVRYYCRRTRLRLMHQ